MKLALPFTVGYILDGVFDAVAVAMLSQYFSYRDIAAYALVDLFMGTTDDFVGGIIDSMDTLNSHALGMENGYLVGQQIQIASIIYSVANIPLLIFWSFATKPLILALGLDMETAILAQRLAWASIPSAIIDGFGYCIDGLLEVTGHDMWNTVVGTIGGGAYTVIIALLCVYWEDADIVMTCWVSLGLSIVHYAYVFTHSYRKGWLDEYIGGMTSRAFSNKRAMRNQTKTAIQLSI